MAVAGAWERRVKAQERLAEADQAVGLAVLEAQPVVPIPDLAELAGVSATELRRVARDARRAAGGSSASEPVLSEDDEDEPSAASELVDLDASVSASPAR